MIRLIGRGLGRLTPRWVHRLGALFGWLLFSVLRIRRRVTLQNIEAALGLPRAARVLLARKVYAHLCTGALELFRAGELQRREAERMLGHGLARLRRHLAGGRGLLVLSAHVGQWDLLACAAARCGLKVNVVTREIKTGWVNRVWMEERAACGVRLLPARGSARGIVAALRRNEVVALVLDQHEPGGAVVPFLGRPAATGTALARLARATGAPVVPVFLLREGLGYKLVVEEPLKVGRGDDVVEVTAAFNRVIEAQVLETPEQWLWLHRRWKVVAPPTP